MPQGKSDYYRIWPGYDTEGALPDYSCSRTMANTSPFELHNERMYDYRTAGFTAASALYKMQLLGQLPSDGPIVVTGATGGVGSMAVSILAKAGFEVIAVTGKTQVNEYLQHLGAARVESREFVKDNSEKSILKPKWSGAIDTVGGTTLTTLLKACKPEGVVVTTGLVDSAKLDGTL